MERHRPPPPRTGRLREPGRSGRPELPLWRGWGEQRESRGALDWLQEQSYLSLAVQRDAPAAAVATAAGAGAIVLVRVADSGDHPQVRGIAGFDNRGERPVRVEQVGGGAADAAVSRQAVESELAQLVREADAVAVEQGCK